MPLDMPVPRILKALNPVWRKNQIQVKWAISELDEILAGSNLRLLLVRQPETNLQ